MTDKVHQSSKNEYQIRVNGVPYRYYSAMSKEVYDTYLGVCSDLPDDYVDIVLIRTEILMSQYDYHQMKRHFGKT